MSKIHLYSWSGTLYTDTEPSYEDIPGFRRQHAILVCHISLVGISVGKIIGSLLGYKSIESPVEHGNKLENGLRSVEKKTNRHKRKKKNTNRVHEGDGVHSQRRTEAGGARGVGSVWVWHTPFGPQTFLFSILLPVPLPYFKLNEDYNIMALLCRAEGSQEVVGGTAGDVRLSSARRRVELQAVITPRQIKTRSDPQRLTICIHSIRLKNSNRIFYIQI